MAPEKEDSATSYRQGIVWLVGLSAAAAGGAFLHYEQVKSVPLFAKWILIIVVLLFLVTVWSGVNCLFWLFRKLSCEEAKKRLDEQHSQGSLSAVDYRTKTQEAEDQLRTARAWGSAYHGCMLWCFGPAVLLATILFACGVILLPEPIKQKSRADSPSTKPMDIKSLPFVLVQSAVHQTAHGREAHTFLLNQQTESLWIMICSKGGTVEFRKLKIFDLAGNLEQQPQ